MLVYAWNEFGEGGYIATTKGDPEGKDLKALKDVVEQKQEGGGGGGGNTGGTGGKGGSGIVIVRYRPVLSW